MPKLEYRTFLPAGLPVRGPGWRRIADSRMRRQPAIGHLFR